MKKQYDIIVAGGGTTGCCAAIAAAGMGATVLLLEKLPFPGGNMTGGLPWLGFHQKNTRKQLVGGLPMRIIRALQDVGGATDFVFDPITGSAVGVNGTMLKMILEKMLADAGVDMRFHSLVYDAKEEGHSATLRAMSKGGTETFSGRFIIDCTDSADISRYMCATLVAGRESDHQRQVSSYVITVGNIRFNEMLRYFEARPDQIRPFPLDNDALQALLSQMKTAPIWVLGAFEERIRQAKAAGLPYPRQHLIGVAYPFNGELLLVSSRVENVEMNDARMHTDAEVEGLQQTWAILELLHRYIPGAERSRIVSTGAQLGIREANHCVGEYVLTADDLLTPTTFPDAICLGAYHMDIHSPDHAGLDTRQPPVYQIPYSSLLVKGTKNLLVAGRGLSATHEAMASTRVAPISAAQGEAAGTAAGLAILRNAELRAIPVPVLREKLLENGVILPPV